jgi:osmotically-inducible protein OsmY
MNRRVTGTFAAHLMTCAMLLSASPLYAQQPPPDNTKVNARDRSPSQATADQQKNNRSDLDITRDIRRAIVSDKSLSTYAHNVKVITRHGEVTLKGPVRTPDERQTIEARAVDVVGAAHVRNQVSVAGAKSKHQ